MQKAKVKWAVEGDENSKKIHGLVNHNITRSRIEGISINGTWITDPKLVISHIFDFHKYKFHDHLLNRPHFTSSLFKTLPDFEVHFLDAPFSINEIKTTVWDCGNSKAPGPDVFTFNFIKQYWSTVGNYFIDMVKRFEVDGFIPKGCNSSFIALAPKIQDPLCIKDFRPISLIGCQYKVIAKILANRLMQVVHLVVSEVQSAYIKERQIIDGPLMVDEIISWASKKKERMFILKVDFEKAFDSLRLEISRSHNETNGF
ncbi:RNA-directed DNA polymerase, eukaryota [Tanacetum coccineum]